MISVVLYGRNDSYGYNLHKRAALSLNCIAALLEDDADEILFVDYNTPNDFPTFPEAIQDTLTDQAKRKLRILRVRPHIHDRLRHRTRLLAIEPHSRNVAVRRSNAENRWILSTNTDMIFVPTHVPSLSEIARHLPAGFYHAPRLEIPETLWEGLNRQRPHDIIETVRAWGWTLHLNEVVKSADFILYDGPGDFQLLERKVLFDTQAFHEDMILGWHVDSNIAKRMFLHYGQIGDLGGEVYGYHCDHTRQITPAHSHSRTQNDPHRFVYDVEQPDIPEQSLTWGCPDDEIEEVRLRGDSSSVYVSALLSAVREPLRTAPVVHYTPEAYNKGSYQPSHVLPFLADLFVCAPRRWNVGWIGEPDETLAMFGQVWEFLGFEGTIIVDEGLVPAGAPLAPRSIRRTTRDALIEQANGFVFNFAVDREVEAGSGVLGEAWRIRPVRHSFFQVVGAEQQRIRDKLPLRQIVAVNAINNDHEGIVTAHVAVGLTPFATRMRHGYVLPAPVGPQDWTPDLWAGAAGDKEGGAIRMRGDVAGFVAYGPYKNLLEGRYRIVFALAGTVPDEGDSDRHIVATVEIRSRGYFIDWGLVTNAHVRRGEFSLEFDVTRRMMDEGVKLETLVRSWKPSDVLLKTLTCEKIGVSSVWAAPDPILGLDDWLPLMSVGPSGRRDGEAVASEPSRPGLLAFGPYWALQSGRYRAEIVMACTGGLDGFTAPGVAVASVEIASGDLVLGGELLLAARMADGRHLVDFTVTPEDAAGENLQVEIRIASWADLPLRISALKVRRVGDAEARRPERLGPRTGWWTGMRLGPAGLLTAEGVVIGSGSPGLVLGRRLTLPGLGERFDLLLDVADRPPGERPSEKPDLLVELVADGSLLARSRLAWGDLTAGGPHGLAFELPPVEGAARTRPLHARVFDLGGGTGLIRDLRLELGGAGRRTAPPPRLTEIDNLLPSLEMGIARLEAGGGAAVRSTQGGLLAFGPHWSMPAGSYRIGLRGALGEDGMHPGLVLEMVVDEVVVSTMTAWPSPGSFALHLDVQVPSPREGHHNIVYFRIFADHARGLVLHALTAAPAEPRGPAAPASLARLPGIGAGDGLVLPAGRRGYHPLGARWTPTPGHYRATVHLVAADVPAALPDAATIAQVEVAAGPGLLALRRIVAGELRSRILSVEVPFAAGGGKPVDVRIWNTGLLEARVEVATLQRIGNHVSAEAVARPAFAGDWLPYLTLGPAGRLSEPEVPGTAGMVLGSEDGGGFLVFGPYRPMAAGPCRATLGGKIVELVASSGLLFEMVVENVVVSSMTAWPRVGRFALVLDGLVSREAADAQAAVQFRVSAERSRGIRLASLVVAAGEAADGQGVVPEAPAVDAHRDDRGGLLIHAGQRGYEPLAPTGAWRRGSYQATVVLRAEAPPDGLADATVLFEVEAVSGDARLAVLRLTAGALRAAEVRADLSFQVRRDDAAECSLRLWSTGLMTVRVESATLRETAGDEPVSGAGAAPTDEDWLPFLALGERGMLSHGLVWASIGEEGPVVSGPGRRLPPGAYRLSVATGLRQSSRRDELRAGRVEVLSGTDVLATAPLSRGSFAAGSPTLNFRVDPAPPGLPDRLVEIRVHATGVEAFALFSVDLRADHEGGGDAA